MTNVKQNILDEKLLLGVRKRVGVFRGCYIGKGGGESTQLPPPLPDACTTVLVHFQQSTSIKLFWILIIMAKFFYQNKTKFVFKKPINPIILRIVQHNKKILPEVLGWLKG